MKIPKLLLTAAEAAEALGVTPRCLEARRYKGNGPVYVRLSSRAVRYRPEDLAAWAAEHLRTSTSDPGPQGT